MDPSASRTSAITGRSVSRRLSGACTTNTASGRVSMRCWNCRFRSTVRKQSKSAAALCKSWPFLMPDQPISATVRTACAVNSARSRFGTHSSSNTRMRERQIPSLLKRCDGKFTCYAWEILQKFIERIATLEIVQQRLKRHASPGKAWGASHDLRITRNSGVHEQIRYRGSADAANSSVSVTSPHPRARLPRFHTESSLSQHSRLLTHR